MTACQAQGEDMYPWGFTMHSILGRTANDITPDGQGRFLKYEATKTNAYNAEYRGTMECTVGGDPDNPAVVSFYLY